MRLALIVLGCAIAVAGCSKKEPEAHAKRELNAAVKEAIYWIGRLERTSASEHSAKILDVRGMSAAQFRRELEAFPGRDVHVWMPGESDWLLVGNLSTNKVPLARVMEEFAVATNCTLSVPEVFASYVGTREDVLPAFGVDLKGDVLPEWFVTKDIPELGWLDTTGIDEDILKPALAEMRSMQVVRRELLRGNMLAAKAKDKKSEEAAKETWARAALRNPRDPMLLERIDNLNRNANGFLAVGKLLQAMKCYETIVLINPKDSVAVHNFGMCLKKIGKKDLAEHALKRAESLAAAREDKAAKETGDSR